MTRRDLERFERFVRTSRNALLRIARNLCRTSPEDPEDLVEETLERAFKKLEEGAASDPLALPFITTVMTNRHIDLCRRRKAEDRSGVGVEQEVDAVVEPEQLERWRSVPDSVVREAMDALEPTRIREAYRLHASGLRYRQIAERLGVPEGTVGSDLFEARRQLRKRLAGRSE